MTTPPLLSVNEAAELLGLAAQTVYRKIDRGEIPAVRVGRTIRVPADKVPGLGSAVGIQKSAGRSQKKSIKRPSSSNNRVPGFLHHLFWEYDIGSLRGGDPIVIERAMELGDLPAVQWLLGSIGRKRLRSFLNEKGARRLSPRSGNFWKMVLQDEQ